MIMVTAALIIGLVLCSLIAFPFIPGLVWALTLTVLFAPVESVLRGRFKLPSLSASVTLVIAAVMVVAPVVLVSKALLNEATKSVGLIGDFLSGGDWHELGRRHPSLSPGIDWITNYLDPEEILQSLKSQLRNWSASLLQGSVTGVVNLLLTFYFLFYFLRDRTRLLAALERILPVTAVEFQKLRHSIVKTIFASVYGTVAVAGLQGLLGGLMFWWLGLPSPVFWGIIMGLLAIVPFLGAFIVWVPASIVLALNGQYLSAVVLAAWGLIVVGLVDNLIYPILVGRQLAMHSMLSFIAIFGGLLLFGTHGIVLGPMILAGSLALLEIWRSRLDLAHGDSQGGVRPSF
jgi:predicted PurR-regulated permease PerM